MKAFLSHSSKDKGVVERVANIIGAAQVELDSQTFEKGVLNSAAIIRSLKRCSLFVLFLSQDSVSASAVRYEIANAEELTASGHIERTLVLCLDAASFELAEPTLRKYNIVRVVASADAVARIIEGQLLAIRSKDAARSWPFVGRTDQLAEITEKLIDPSSPRAKALFVSGMPGIGRRTFTRHLYEDVFPAVNRVFPQIYIDPIDGLEEIYRKLLAIHSPIQKPSQLRALYTGFALASEEGKATQIATLVKSIADGREALLLVDRGGLLDDNGLIQLPLRSIYDRLDGGLYPSIVFVAERMVPKGRRDHLSATLFTALPALTPAESRRLMGLILKRLGVTYTNIQLQDLSELSDFHPFNISFIAEAAKEKGIDIFLRNPESLGLWKHKRGAEFLKRLVFDDVETRVIAALVGLLGLPFEVLVSLAKTDAERVAVVVGRMLEFHILEYSSDDLYSISRPLRTAVERDRRFRLPTDEYKEIFLSITQSLQVAGDSDQFVSTSLVEAGIIAQLQGGGEVDGIFTAFLLPSHRVWLSRKRYDAGHYDDALGLASAALDAESRLSPAGVVEACRLLCLSAARLNRQDKFERGIGILRRLANDSWAGSNLNFLLGFNCRLSGNQPKAEEFFRQAYRLSPGNFSAARELSAVCLARGDLASAEKFAREAYAVASDNAYVIDVLLSVILNSREAKTNAAQNEIETLFSKLEDVGEEHGHSFYTTRRAEFELKQGSLQEARRLIDDAARKTNHLFAVHALRAEIYLESGNNIVAMEEIEKMDRVLKRPKNTERRTNVRRFLELKSRYFSAVGKYDDAKQIYRDRDVFTESESLAAIKIIEYDQAYARR